MVKKKETVKEKWKGKEWFQIVAPKMFQNAVIGETPSVDASFLNGRIIEASLIELGGDPRKYYMKFLFKVDTIEGSRAITKFFGYDITRDFIARVVSVGTSRIDINDTIEMKDGKMIVKSIIITNRPIKTNVKKEIRKVALASVKRELEKLTFDEFVSGIISDKIQKIIKKDISKIYPLRFFEFRRTQTI